MSDRVVDNNNSSNHAKIRLLPYLCKLTNNSDGPEAFGIDHSELAWVECWDMWYVWVVVLNDWCFIVTYKIVYVTLLFLQGNTNSCRQIFLSSRGWRLRGCIRTRMESSLAVTYQLTKTKTFKNRWRSWIMMLQSESLIVTLNERKERTDDCIIFPYKI